MSESADQETIPPVTPRPPEKELYDRLWEMEEYRVDSLGEKSIQTFLETARPRRGAGVLDLGCGTGRAGLLLAAVGNLDVTMVDFSDKCLDEDIRPALETQSHCFRFVQADLNERLPCAALYGFCADVLEHIPTEQVDTVLSNILHACQHVFLQISTRPDVMGELVGHPLHLTVQPYAWWLRRLMEQDCIIHWSQKHDSHVQFYVTAWMTGNEVADAGELNTEEKQVLANVQHNTRTHFKDLHFRRNGMQGSLEHKAATLLLSEHVFEPCPGFHEGGPLPESFSRAGMEFGEDWVYEVHFGPFPEGETDYDEAENKLVPRNHLEEVRIGYSWGNSFYYLPYTRKQWEEALLKVGATIPRWQQVIPHPTNDTEVMILGGGPSLSDYEETIRTLQARGVKIVTLNGAYQWAQERGIGPVNQIMVDARPFNARFVQPIDPANLYFIASQCDPSVFEGLPPERTYIWHTSAEFLRDALDDAYNGEWFGIPGGSTVLLRAIPLLRMIGFKSFHLFGCDSCLSGDAHHAYPQPENDHNPVVPVTVGRRVFWCHPWMSAQASEMITLIQQIGDEIELKIYGDGLLAAILETGAEMAEEEGQDAGDVTGNLQRNVTLTPGTGSLAFTLDEED